MRTADMRARIESLSSHVLFDYNGKHCGIDPFAHDHFDMWCGEDTMTAKSIDEVMQVPFFNGKALQDIMDKIQNIEM